MIKLKITELSRELGESPNVIRNWLRDFKVWIPIEKAENGYNLFPPEAVEVLRKIQNLHRKQGYSTRQIEHHLATGSEVSAAAAADPMQPVQAEEMAEVKSMLSQLLELQGKQQEFNRSVLERMDQREKLWTDYISERRQLMIEQKKPRSWLSKLFRKR